MGSVFLQRCKEELLVAFKMFSDFASKGFINSLPV